MDIWIDNRYYNVNQNYTIFQFCAKLGINLPNFCYHERLSIAGNCRICLVEANSALVISCATILLDKMNIYTKTKRVKKAREGVLEFLLVNHPLDCPVCDQGGNCDLQDISLLWSSDRGRFYELNKRSVTNLHCAGPFIKTVMTRCIHCTRCVRFSNEISGINNFGIIGRGNLMEIGTYIESFINNELISNIIDLCPVGALIAMPSSFYGRSWELKYIKSIDLLDALGSNIKLAIASNSVIRVLPCLDNYYDEWITNKTRFIFDSFNIQRLYYPKLRLYFKFIILSWKLVILLFLNLLVKKLKNNIEVKVGPYLSLELALILKYFFNSIGNSNINYFEHFNIFIDFRFSYLLNTTIINLTKISSILLISCNPRLESPVLNSYPRKNYLHNPKFKIYSIGLGFDYLTYPVINIGNSLKNVISVIWGLSLVSKYFLFSSYYSPYFFNIKKLVVIHFFLSSSILTRIDSNSILNIFIYFISKFNLSIKYLNILQRYLGRISYSEEYLLNRNNKKLSIFHEKYSTFYYLIGVDSFKLNKIKNNFIIYQGFYYISNFFKNINLILPTSIYIEHIASYINLEGRFRSTNKAITPFKFIFIDTNIIKSFSIFLHKFYVDYFSIFYLFFLF